MNAINRSFTKIINGVTQFVIPVFQRDYRWTDEDCEQLWKDVLAVATDPTDRRSLSSIVQLTVLFSAYLCDSAVYMFYGSLR